MLGTLYNGAALINSECNIISHYNKSNGLQDETIIDISLDKNKNIWFALNNGIYKIEQNNPIRHFSEKQGIHGLIQGKSIQKISTENKYISPRINTE